MNPPDKTESDTLHDGDHWTLDRSKPLQATARLLFGLCLLPALWATAPQAADDWRQFRGPNGDGFSKAKNLPLHWGETNNITWKSPIPSIG